jgi:integrase
MGRGGLIVKLIGQRVEEVLQLSLEGIEPIQGLSLKTISNVHVMLHRALAQAVKRKLMSRNPASIVEKPKPKRHEINPWTAEETSRFLAAAEGHRLYPAFLLMASVGLRRGEALGPRWDDLNFATGTLAVRRALVLVDNVPTISEPKTDAGRRSIPLRVQTIAALRAHREAQAEERLANADVYQDAGLIFAQGGWLADPPGTVPRRLPPDLEGGWAPPTRPHDLRHGWCGRSRRACRRRSYRRSSATHRRS